ncbi:MAG TPA: serine hydrolase domain-containing protein, partial [Vicinamibacterales bacterium]|nr:serine hydrolase domain-containing protein [Vicinamibacterales bacterium]
AAVSVGFFMSAGATWPDASTQLPPSGSPELSTERRPFNGPELERLADAVFAPYLREFAQPSLAVAIVQGESFVWSKGYGLERAHDQRPVDPDETLFNVASVSKLFTATAAMQLVERGALALDEDIRRRLGSDIIRGSRGAVTLRHLLTHTSGLDGAFMRDVVADPQKLIPLREYFRRFPPVASRAPGREIRYSNVGMALAGRLVEEASGLRFEDFVDQQVLLPLGMQHSSFRQPPPEPLRERVATYGSGPVPDALLLAPAGAMVSTVSDIARFMRMHLGYSTRILSDDALRRMHEVQWQASPQSPGAALGFFTTDLGGPSGLFHTGARVHFSLLYLEPAHRLGIFIVHAMRQGGRHQSLRAEFVRAVLAKYFGTPPVATGSHRDSWPSLERYAGLYRPILLSTATIERAATLAMDTPVTVEGGVLAVAVPTGPRLMLRRVEADHFRVEGGRDDGLHVVFMSSAGSITGFSMSGNTQDPVSFHRLRWFESGRLHAVLLASIVFLLASAPVGTGVGMIIARFRRGANTRPTESTPERWAWRAAVTAGGLTLAAPLATAALVVLHQGEDNAAEGLRTALTAGATIELVALIPTLAIPAVSVAAWRRGFWSYWKRVYYTAIGVGVVLAIPLLYHYRLLGYQF